MNANQSKNCQWNILEREVGGKRKGIAFVYTTNILREEEMTSGAFTGDS